MSLVEPGPSRHPYVRMFLILTRSARNWLGGRRERIRMPEARLERTRAAYREKPVFPPNRLGDIPKRERDAIVEHWRKKYSGESDARLIPMIAEWFRAKLAR